jgi:hypothetical protein
MADDRLKNFAVSLTDADFVRSACTQTGTHLRRIAEPAIERGPAL